MTGLAFGVLACEAVTHSNDFSTAAPVQTCGEGTLFCNGACIAEDRTNCGSCGFTCEPTQVCSNGTCGSQCTGGLTLCGDANSARCVDTLTDPQNCGRCGGPPDAGACPFCSNGECVSQCSPPSTACGGSCVDTTSDPNNCGTCGNPCKGDKPLCLNGKCAASCGGEEVCSGRCTDTQLDPRHCGSCEKNCPEPPHNANDQPTGVAVCLNGNTCSVSCLPGLTTCVNPEANGGGVAAVCVDISSDTNNCGTCNHACNSGALPTCHQGVCISG